MTYRFTPAFAEAGGGSRTRRKYSYLSSNARSMISGFPTSSPKNSSSGSSPEMTWS